MRRKPLPKPQVTGNLFTCHGRDSNPGSGTERQLAFSGNSLDPMGIRAGPVNNFNTPQC